MLVSAMIFEGCLRQDTEWIGPFLPPKSLGPPSLEHFHFGLANMHPRPIVIFHVSQKLLLLVGLSQQPLQMCICLDENGLSVSGQWVTGSSSVQDSVTTNPP